MQGELCFGYNDGTGDSLIIGAHNGEINFSINEPWAGSTETGFGVHSSYTLTRAQARELLTWLTEQIV